ARQPSCSELCDPTSMSDDAIWKRANRGAELLALAGGRCTRCGGTQLSVRRDLSGNETITCRDCTHEFDSPKLKTKVEQIARVHTGADLDHVRTRGWNRAS